jgi:hypothetical protein
MKKSILVLALSALVAFSVAAEGAAVDSKGTLGLQFTVSGLIGSTSVSGVPVELPSGTAYGISGKYYLMDKLGLGLGFYLAGASNSGVSTSDLYLGLKPSVSYTLVKKGPVELYAGGYLSLGLYNYENTTTSYKSSIFGFGGTIGAEYFVLNGISLGAEYNLGMNFNNTSSTTKPGGVTTTGSSTDWGTNAASIFLTFYF